MMQLGSYGLLASARAEAADLGRPADSAVAP